MTATRWEYCDIPECGLSTDAVTVTKTQATSEMSVSTGIEQIDTNGEMGMWNDWKFCEVHCVREDTIEGTQRRWITCNGSECSGMRPRKLLCKCPKRLINIKWHNLDGKNITHSEVKEKVLEDFNKNIKSEISVDRKTVTKEVRKKISSVNKRQSSQPIGWGCIVFMGLPTFFLIAMDLIN
ncbi:unnamed protein product [Mytilus edulis]|uniref:Uncharacterized protein n=1 Tax=Mytilus edulis TaxID=6550 RepID=A0A8S3U2C8_MYTED|nr:unnamed protein product [Mytilus edulis]